MEVRAGGGGTVSEDRKLMTSEAECVSEAIGSGATAKVPQQPQLK